LAAAFLYGPQYQHHEQSGHANAPLLLGVDVLGALLADTLVEELLVSGDLLLLALLPAALERVHVAAAVRGVVNISSGSMASGAHRWRRSGVTRR
jgi:hypothetical protein